MSMPIFYITNFNNYRFWHFTTVIMIKKEDTDSMCHITVIILLNLDMKSDLKSLIYQKTDWSTSSYLCQSWSLNEIYIKLFHKNTSPEGTETSRVVYFKSSGHITPHVAPLSNRVQCEAEKKFLCFRRAARVRFFFRSPGRTRSLGRTSVYYL